MHHLRDLHGCFWAAYITLVRGFACVSATPTTKSAASKSPPPSPPTPKSPATPLPPPPLPPPSPHQAPGQVSVSAVSSTISFTGLSLDSFDDPTFNSTFRAEFVAQLAAAANVSTAVVYITSIADGSTQVASVVEFPSQFSAASPSTFLAEISSATSSIFTFASFASYGTITSSSGSISE
ncbi:hypothetical protein CYMTET_33984, partial [Cymbomonas tetramitiformis]